MYEKGKMGHLDAILALAAWHGRLNGTNNHNILTSALIGAASLGHVSITEHLITQQGAEVNPGSVLESKHQHGSTIIAEYCPLHAAAYHAFDADTCKMLLAHGARVDTKDPTGMTALLYAAKRADRGASIQIIKALISQGADVRATTQWGATPLHLAAQCSSWTNSPSMKEDIERRICRAARTLLKAGADINARDNQGRAPLHLARFKGMYIWLQEHGADETIRGNDGLLPKEYFDTQEEKRSRASMERRLNNPARQKFGPAASLELEWD
ncbi:ankyrin repeat-containing domain protein [Aspergillus pseudoustus]|uniref:Ankyrin repeat-containing domain protein n=1 Tax=Aspergillus pseudoustus TaxID=1810923 RepID=A0ABR4K7V9_9EURO